LYEIIHQFRTPISGVVILREPNQHTLRMIIHQKTRTIEVHRNDDKVITEITVPHGPSIGLGTRFDIDNVEHTVESLFDYEENLLNDIEVTSFTVRARKNSNDNGDGISGQSSN